MNITDDIFITATLKLYCRMKLKTKIIHCVKLRELNWVHMPRDENLNCQLGARLSGVRISLVMVIGFLNVRPATIVDY